MENKAFFSQDEQCQRLWELEEIKNIMNKHSFYYSNGQRRQELSDIWVNTAQNRRTASLGNNWGYYVGMEDISNYYVVQYNEKLYQRLKAYHEADPSVEMSSINLGKGTIKIVSPSTGEVVYEGQGKGRATEIDSDPFVRFNASNVSLKGSLYNGTGYYGEEARKLVVTLGTGASLEGGISATETIHVNEKGEHNTFFTIKQFYYLGHVANRNFFNGDNDVFVELADGALWRVTEESVITKLTVGDGCVFEGKVFKDGQQIKVMPGEVYEGVMKVVPLD